MTTDRNNSQTTMINRFKAMYIAALAVIAIGIMGIVILPKAHADSLYATAANPTVSTDVRSQAGRYMWKVTSARLHNRIVSVLTPNF